MDNDFSTINAEECEENERAFNYLAKELGVGHYNNLNLLILSALVIFISVAFLAVNSGKIDDNETVNLSLKSFLSGEYTRSLTERYNEQLPIPELMKSAEERVSLIYGFGNKLDEKDGSTATNNGSGNTNNDLFEPSGRDEDDGRSENRLTVTTVITNENGEVVTSSTQATEANGGTTPVTRPPETSSTRRTTTTEESTTTTNNTAPTVTTTTTFIVSRDTETEPTETEPTETVPTETEPTETEITEPTETEITEPTETTSVEETDEEQ